MDHGMLGYRSLFLKPGSLLRVLNQISQDLPHLKTGKQWSSRVKHCPSFLDFFLPSCQELEHNQVLAGDVFYWDEWPRGEKGLVVSRLVEWSL